MKARDVMTSSVVSVGPDTPMREVAKVLRDHGISAVPVLDAADAPIGMISEGDLIGRDDVDRNARRDWWLSLLADGEALNPDFLACLRRPERRAGDMMTGPVVAIGEDTEIAEIARLLTVHRIKRVPVLRAGQLVGIVSRADLVRALAAENPQPAAKAKGGFLAEALAGIDQRFLHREQPATLPEAPAEPDRTTITVQDFRSLVIDHEHEQAQREDAQHREIAERRRQRIGELIDEHVSDAAWRELLHRAKQAAENGERELMLLRFPSQLCSDGGRAINVVESDWPTTLRGEAGELYLRWEHDLKPSGFLLAARMLDFPGGMPGDIGLSLVWGV
jgi:CBS domain-containing protein